jgi:hypothetical protein
MDSNNRHSSNLRRTYDPPRRRARIYVDNPTDSVDVAQKLALSSATNTCLDIARRTLCMTVR